MRPRRKESLRHVEAVLKALDVLDIFLEQPEANVRDLMHRLGLTRSRAMRLAGTLEARGYLAWNPETGRYHLGAKALALGHAFEKFNGLRRLARPILRRLVAATEDSAALYVLEGTERVVLAREEGTRAIRYAVPEGQRLYLHAGSGGKAILAFCPPDFIDRVLQGELPALAKRTITDPDLLRQELAKIRRQGYAVSRGERYEEAYGVGVPVFGPGGRLVGSLSIVAPAERMTAENLRQRRDLLLRAAGELSAALGDRSTLTERT